MIGKLFTVFGVFFGLTFFIVLLLVSRGKYEKGSSSKSTESRTLKENLLRSEKVPIDHGKSGKDSQTV